MKNTILNFGTLYGIALVIGFLGSYLILGDTPDNYSRGEIVGYSIMLISSVAVIYGIKAYKETRNFGQLTFLKGVSVGVSITAIASAIFAAYTFLYLRWLNPEFTQTYMEYSRQQILQSSESAEVKELQLAELSKYAELMSNDYLQSALMFVTVFLIGLLFTLVSAAAMRTSNKTHEE